MYIINTEYHLTDEMKINSECTLHEDCYLPMWSFKSDTCGVDI